MNKRIRKKRRVGEFKELGFVLTFALSNDVADASVDRFVDDFVNDVVERRGLVCDGGCGRTWDVFVTKAKRMSATDDDRAAVAAWLGSRSDVGDVHVGPLVDAWNPEW